MDVAELSPRGNQQIESSRLYEAAVVRIEQRIFDGDLCIGDKLQPEKVLAEEFGVSRTVIREAMQSLKSKGLVSVKQGAGVFVTAPTKETITRLFSTVCQLKGDDMSGWAPRGMKTPSGTPSFVGFV
jgi:DNA-binding FadR family transcriptional regulator